MAMTRREGTICNLKTKCPECGKVATCRYTSDPKHVVCPECGAEYGWRANVYRPLTDGLTEEQRRRFYNRNAYSTPERRERANERCRKWQREHRDEVNARRRERNRTPEAVAKRREYYRRNRERILEAQKAYRVRKELGEYKARKELGEE